MTRKTRIITILFFALSGFCFADANLAELKNSAINTKPEYFKAGDEFIIIGKIFVIDKYITFAYNKHIWGEAKRMSGRVLLFDEDAKMLGIYGVINSRPVISGKTLVFPFAENDGNAIDFSNGFLESVRLDGEIITYEDFYNRIQNENE